MGEISWGRAFNYAASFVMYTFILIIVGSSLIAVGGWLVIKSISLLGGSIQSSGNWDRLIAGFLFLTVGVTINSLAAIAAYFKLMSKLIHESSAGPLTPWKGASSCPNCGKKLLPIAAVFCPFCGFDLSKDTQSKEGEIELGKVVDDKGGTPAFQTIPEKSPIQIENVKLTKTDGRAFFVLEIRNMSNKTATKVEVTPPFGSLAIIDLPEGVLKPDQTTKYATTLVGDYYVGSTYVIIIKASYLDSTTSSVVVSVRCAW